MFDISPKNLRLTNYLLTVLIVCAVVLVMRDVMTASLLKKKPVTAAENGKMEQPAHFKKNLTQYASILEKNPFGRPMRLYTVDVSPKGEEEKDITLSDLVLVGTAVGSKNFGYAVFEDKARPGQQDVFSIGENVFDYGRLKKISRTSVEIVRNSSTYTVSIPDVTIMTDMTSGEEGDTQQDRPSFAKKLSEREYILDSRKVQKSLESPEQILTDARLLPNIQNGIHEGFTISEVVPGGIYHSLGLRNGDILLQINGLEISNPEVAIQAMSALRGMNTVNLDIVRNGQNMSMNYRIK